MLYLGALGDRYGRKLMLVLGMVLSIPACLLAAYAPSDSVLFLARLLGGLSAGMAYPTTLALIAALWSGPGRTTSIALWSAIGGGIAALGPLVAGFLLEHFWWGSVFLVTLPLAVVALVLAVVLVPAHVNETTEPVDNLGGVLSVVARRSDDPGDQLRPGPGQGDVGARCSAPSPSVALVAFVVRQRRAAVPLYDLHVAGAPHFWVAACAGIIVFGSLMGAAFISQQFLQNVLGYSTLDAGAAFLPAIVFMILVAPRSAKLVEAHGARFTLLARLRLPAARLPDDAAAVEGGQPVLAGRAGLHVHRDRRRLRRHAGVALADGVRARRSGPGWRRGPPTCSATSAARSCSRSSARC